MRLRDQRQHLADLVADLVQRAEVVRVVERDRAHPGQAAEHAGALGAILRSDLGDPQRQVAVGARRATKISAWCGHSDGRSMNSSSLGQRHAREHVVAEVLPVAGSLVQLALAEQRRIDVLVAGAAFGLADVGLDLVAGGGAGRQPERQAGADQRIGVEEVEFAAELAVVDHGGLLRGMGATAGHAKRPGRSPGALR